MEKMNRIVVIANVFGIQILTIIVANAKKHGENECLVVEIWNIVVGAIENT
jgi:hypothetical protein